MNYKDFIFDYENYKKHKEARAFFIDGVLGVVVLALWFIVVIFGLALLQ